MVLRFLPEGPSIPDELLVARDEGRVVFFCGAGVSRARAGLSDFLGLTKTVADKLAIAADSPTRKLIDAIERFPPITGVGSLVSADRIFGLIEREFLSRDIYAAIASSLKQYLLEALNRTAGSLSGVYAFQSGSKEDAEAQWFQKGVHPIAYDAKSNHDGLWNTLDAWAARARNPDEWYNRLIEAAKNGPEGFQPYQRGQAAHVVSTLEGARKFSRASNTPPATWLCSFDPYVRFARPSRRDTALGRGLYFDPFDAYGLDSDPVPKKLDPDDAYGKRDVPTGVWDCFIPTRQDRQNVRDDQFAAFRGHYSRNVPGLTARLGLIEDWITKVARQPAAVWWAARQTGLHPNVQQQIKYEIERNSAEFPAVVRKTWRYIFEAWSFPRNEFYSDWFELAAVVKADGWSPSTVRQVAKIKRPYLSVESPFGAARPPEPSEDLPLSDLARVDVKYPDINEDVAIPSEHLALFVNELRKNLELAVALENEIGGYGLHILNPIEPDEPERHPYGINKAVIEFVKFFRRLAEEDLRAAKAEAVGWRENKDDVFIRLVVWACSDRRITLSADAGRILSKLDTRAFWDSRGQRDLLITLSKRWPKLSPAARKGLESKLLKGRSRWKNERLVEFKQRRASQILSRIYWLAAQGCKFGFNLDKETARLKADVPGWQESYADHAADSMASRAGWVRTDTESTALLQVPLSEVLPTAQTLSGRRGEFFVEHDPYAGLAATRPVRALAALGAVEDGYEATWAWETFLNAQARRDDKPRFMLVIAARLSRLKDADFGKLVRPVSDWLLRASKNLLVHGRDKFERLWEKLITILTTDQKTGDSAIIAQDEQHDWATEALNSPAGYMAQALFNDLGSEIQRAAGLPEEWRERAEQLLSLPGNPRRHALAIFCHNLTYLFHIDPEWTERALLSAIIGNDDDDTGDFGRGSSGVRGLPKRRCI